MDDPYSKAAKVLDTAGGGSKSSRAPSAAKSTASSIPDVVVGRKYTDPQSRADEEYMEGAQRDINRKLMRGAERLSGEYRSRRFNDRRYGRRSGR